MSTNAKERQGTPRKARRRQVAAGITLTPMMMATASVTATAAPAYCSAGYACLWEDHSYLTDGRADWEYKFQYKQPNLNNAYYYYFKTPQDNASSVFNNGNYQSARFYKHINFGGPSFILSINTGDHNLADNLPVPSGFNDTLSSVCFVNHC